MEKVIALKLRLQNSFGKVVRSSITYCGGFIKGSSSLTVKKNSLNTKCVFIELKCIEAKAIFNWNIITEYF